jgi:hypothetical protein
VVFSWSSNATECQIGSSKQFGHPLGFSRPLHYDATNDVNVERAAQKHVWQASDASVMAISQIDK